MFTAHVSVCLRMHVSPPPHPAPPRDEQMDAVGRGGGRSLARGAGKQKEGGRSSLSPLLLSTVTQDTKLCHKRVRLTGDTKVPSRERLGDIGTMQIAAWVTKVTLCWRSDTGKAYRWHKGGFHSAHR